MKIRIDKDIVTFTPEHASEKAELEALWIKMGNCVGENKSLEPMGVYIPSENPTATFHIAGLSEPLMTPMCTVSPATKPSMSKPAKLSPSAAVD